MLLEPEIVENTLFGQQHARTQDFFLNKYGSAVDVRTVDLPHVLFALGDESAYREYLDVSWSYYFPQNNTEERREEKVQQFHRLIEDIDKNGIKEEVLMFRRFDGELVVLSGNHRCAAALALQKPVPVKIVDTQYVVSKHARVEAGFYGEKGGMPYQSLFHEKQEIIHGRRPDIMERLGFVLKKDLKGSVLDLGSNIGSNCFAASELGAKSVVGIEKDHRLVTAAIRLNTVYGTNALFYSRDLSGPITDVAPADTVFCFSIAAHVKNKDALVDNVMRLTKKVMYFECHADTDRKDYEYLLNKSNFSSITKRGMARAGAHSPAKVRPVYRCVV